MTFNELINNIGNVIEPIQEQFKLLIPGIAQDIDYIITNKIQDVDRIEKLSDDIINIHNMVDVEYLFDKLMNYYSTFEKENAAHNRKFFIEFFQEDSENLDFEINDESNENTAINENDLIKNAFSIIKNGKSRLNIEANLLVIKTFWELGRLLNLTLTNIKDNSPEFKEIISKMSISLRENEKGSLLYTEEHLWEMYQLYKLLPDFLDIPTKLRWSHYHLIFSKTNRELWLKYIYKAEKESYSIDELKLMLDRI